MMYPSKIHIVCHRIDKNDHHDPKGWIPRVCTVISARPALLLAMGIPEQEAGMMIPVCYTPSHFLKVVGTMPCPKYLTIRIRRGQ